MKTISLPSGDQSGSKGGLPGAPVVRLPQGESPAQAAAVLARADLTRASGNADAARDAVAFLLGLPYLPPADRTVLERIRTLPAPRRDAMAVRVAARLEREAVHVGFSDPATPELVAARLGCVVDQPEYPGLDLAALCLKGG